MSESSLGAEVIRWARAEPTVSALVLIGSRARVAQAAADRHSDWDFQVITSRPEILTSREWTRALPGGAATAYVIREGRLGSAQKVSAVFPHGELDLVVLPTRQLSKARWLTRLGLVSALPGVRAALQGFAVVLRDGYRFEKGESEWATFYRSVATDIPATRLSDDQVLQIAEGFVCDYVSTVHKIERGELLAAQRWLHVHLVEANLRLVHELRQRCGLVSFPDGRRLEFLSTEAEKIGVASTLGTQPLTSAVEKAATLHRELVSELVGSAWRWPELPSHLRSK